MASAMHGLTMRLPGVLQHSNWGISAILGVKKHCEKRTYFTYSRELCHIVDHEPKVVTAEEAVKCINSCSTVFLSGAASTPIELANAMAHHAKQNNLKDITVCHMHTEGPALYAQKEFEPHFRSLSFFMAGNVRQAVNEGRADAIPIFLQDIPSLFHRKIVQPDVAMCMVSPPDKHGFCSFGTSVDCVKAGVMNSKIIIAHVNSFMPRTFGDGVVHMSHFDYIFKKDTPLPDHGSGAGSPEETAIGKHIAENLVEDGATLQMGIGSIPDAVLALLENHKDLGIHTEMFAVGVINLVKKGAVTNSKKPIHGGKIVSSFLIGTKELYDFVDNNPSVLMKVVDYTNSTAIIRIHPKMTSINSAIEVDLTGQVCSDSIGTKMFSGFGGQVDFHRGAAEGIDGKGKAIIALQSTIKKNNTSKIVPMLKPGAGVVTTRAHINYVVTEYGIAPLFGKTLRQRAHALINVAHPDHREALEKAAFERFKTMPCP